MSRLNLVFKLIKSLKMKAVLLFVIIMLAEFAVVYMEGLYRLPRLYENRLKELNDVGKVLYFDTLGERVDIQGLLKEKSDSCRAEFASYICNAEIDGNVYYLKAVSSDFVFADDVLAKSENSETLQIVSSRTNFGEHKVGEEIPVLLVSGSQKANCNMKVGKILRNDEPVLNFQVGSNAVSSYNMFAPAENDIYVNMDEVFDSPAFSGLNIGKDAFYPRNGIIIFNRGVNEEEYEAVRSELLRQNLSVQEFDEIEARTRKVSENNIKSQVSLPLLVMLLSLVSSVAILIFSIDSERKNISLIGLVGCSRRGALTLQSLVIFFILLPGFLVNASWILYAVVKGVQLFDNVRISGTSMAYWGGTAVVFWLIGVIIALVLFRGSYIEQKTEEM